MTTDTDTAEKPLSTDSRHRVRWRLHVVASPDRAWRGRILELDAAGVQIGRRTQSAGAVEIDDSTLSRKHLELMPLPSSGGVALRDLGSHNGTFRGGVQVSAATLGDAAVLRFGESVAVLEADSGAAAAFATPTRDIPGRSETARVLRAALDAAARDGTPALLFGATGTGKEFAAQEVHRRSGRPGGLLRAPTAGASAAGVFAAWLGDAALFGHASALPNSVLLDGLDDFDPAAQLSLLHALDAASGVKPTVQWLATAADSFELKLQSGALRRDLLARFCDHLIRLPPLADRKPDLLDLADAMLPWEEGGGWAQHLEADTVVALLVRPWPANLRGLLATLRFLRRQYVGAQLPVGALPPDSLRQQQAGRARQRPIPPEFAEMDNLLLRYEGRIERLAEHYGRHRKQMYRWLERVGIGDEALQQYRRGERG